MATREILPAFSNVFSKSMAYKRYKARKPNAKGRKSDSGIVPMKLGNSDGGKARYQLLPLIGKHLLHTEVGILNGNKTRKDSKIS